MPQDKFKDANIVQLYEDKGDRESCDNHRGISVLRIAGKIIARIILNRVTQHPLDDVVSESLCGFRRNRGTILEKCRGQNQNLYTLQMDLANASDIVSREGL